MNNVTITQNAWQQEIKAVEGLRALMEDTPLGATNEDEIVDRYADARDSLMGSPAPDLGAAAQWKLSIVHQQVRDGMVVKADVEALLDDIKRLAAN
ncbi:hypothetical protein [uncultured Parasphingorhabdus sp.]|uniref:hypothetical protein n=1 Tax=uncultured Parasphingorhabdus sp. TaxID=2709694 RepID=UPI002AA940E2|nr:hypothetical protein [uncultured Parasphingorhabdus sp.]